MKITEFQPNEKELKMPEQMQKIDPRFRRILVVDDDEQIRDMLKLTLETEGFQVQTARDGRDILKRTSVFEPHLIISDVMMPGGGGYDVLRNLQSDAMTRETPVIIITGYAFDNSTKDMLNQEPNVKAFIDKPIRPPLLLSQIHGILNTKSKEEKLIDEQKQNVRELDLNKFDDMA